MTDRPPGWSEVWHRNCLQNLACAPPQPKNSIKHHFSSYHFMICTVAETAYPPQICSMHSQKNCGWLCAWFEKDKFSRRTHNHSYTQCDKLTRHFTSSTSQWRRWCKYFILTYRNIITTPSSWSPPRQGRRQWGQYLPRLEAGQNTPVAAYSTIQYNTNICIAHSGWLLRRIWGASSCQVVFGTGINQKRVCDFLFI